MVKIRSPESSPNATIRQLRAARLPPTFHERLNAAQTIGYIGITLICVFIFTILFSAYKNTATIPVLGTVISDRSIAGIEKVGSSPYRSYSYSFEYHDKDGVKRHGATFINNDLKFSLGELVSIGYYPNNFDQVRVRSWLGFWKLQLTLLGLGIVLIWYSILAVRQVKSEANIKSTAKKK